MSKIIIVGGGVAGLSAGIYARLNGYDATIYEKHYEVGGNLTGWDRNGYHIDNCIHWLTGTNPNTSLYKMWNDLGALKDVDIYQGESLYTFEKDGKRISLYNDINKTQEEMLRIAPNDKKEIDSFIKAVKVMQKINGVGGVNNNEKSTIMEKVKATPILLKYYNLTTGELASKFTNPLIKGFIESLISEYFSSLALILVFATFSGKNGGIPVGSSSGMAKRMKERFLELGGEICLKQGVEKINLNGDFAESITLDNGEIVFGDYIIVSGDPRIIFSKLLKEEYMPKSLKKQYDNPKLMRFSSYHCAFGCNEEKLPFKGDFIFEVPSEYQTILNTKYLMMREFSHEPSFAPKGKNIIQTMTYCKEDDALKFIELNKDENAYKEKKKELASIIKKIIVSKFNELDDKLDCIDVWTPSTYKRYTNSDIGSFMGFLLPSKTIPFNISNRIEGVKNVVLASQWLQIPGGLPIAAKVGKRAVETVIVLDKK